ncbi:hypothetical protein [Neobacillus vireti]|uniref:hypothetical protein n=1 Tax=Neobacillus vireti TaxID=220686 RepID=UPI000429CFBD|nr:hypothetical protein [Neobacillus vireti]
MVFAGRISLGGIITKFGGIRAQVTESPKIDQKFRGVHANSAELLQNLISTH